MYRVNNLLFVHTIFACIFGVKLKIFPGGLRPPNPIFSGGLHPPDPLLCHLENPFQNSWLRHWYIELLCSNIITSRSVLSYTLKYRVRNISLGHI